MNRTAILSKLRIGMTRAEVEAAIGPPDHTGGTSRKHRLPTVYKYGDIELFFGHGAEGKLHMAYTEDAHGNGVVLLQ